MRKIFSETVLKESSQIVKNWKIIALASDWSSILLFRLIIVTLRELSLKVKYYCKPHYFSPMEISHRGYRCDKVNYRYSIIIVIRMTRWVVVQFEVLLLAEVNLSKNPRDAGDSPMFLSPIDSVAYLPSAASQWSESNH